MRYSKYKNALEQGTQKPGCTSEAAPGQQLGITVVNYRDLMAQHFMVKFLVCFCLFFWATIQFLSQFDLKKLTKDFEFSLFSLSTAYTKNSTQKVNQAFVNVL